ncbi:MAG: O-antigen ligase family protein, partial [Chloroflexaceae bacterium]|nr:O-antigen ligase family protein [Chloroflexaceae bacterium]
AQDWQRRCCWRHWQQAYRGVLGWCSWRRGGLLLATALVLRHHLRGNVGRWLWLGVAAALALAVLGGSGLLPDFLTQRLATITNNLRLFDVRSVEVTPENFSVVERMALLQAGWQMFLHEPVTGVGPGNYPIAYAGSNSRDPYLLHPWYYPHQHAHNYYLHMAAEAGIIGAIAYLVLLALVCAQAFFSLLRVRGWFWQGITVGGCGIIASVAVHNLFENLHVLNMGVQLGAVWGMLVAIERQMQTRMEKQ